MGSKMEWAVKGIQLGGIPRKMAFVAVGAFSKAVATVLNTTDVHNADTLLRLVRHHPPGVPLITVSTLLQLHTFPEGKVSQEDSPIRRLKWGTANLVDRAPITPIVLPIFHHGLHEVMPEKLFRRNRPPGRLWNKRINVVIGEPIEFNLPQMWRMAVVASLDKSLPITGWPSPSPHGLDVGAQRCLYTDISERIRVVMVHCFCSVSFLDSCEMTIQAWASLSQTVRSSESSFRPFM